MTQCQTLSGEFLQLWVDTRESLSGQNLSNSWPICYNTGNFLSGLGLLWLINPCGQCCSVISLPGLDSIHRWDPLYLILCSSYFSFSISLMLESSGSRGISWGPMDPPFHCPSYTHLLNSHWSTLVLLLHTGICFQLMQIPFSMHAHFTTWG